MKIDKHYAAAAVECLKPEAAAKYLAGDMEATDEVGHNLIAETAARLAEEEREKTMPGTWPEEG